MLLNTPFVSCAAASRDRAAGRDPHRRADRGLDEGTRQDRRPGPGRRARDEQAVRPREAAPGQAGLQPLARPHQPDAERADRTAELPGRRLERQALEVAEDDRLAVLPRQPLDLLVQEPEVAIVFHRFESDIAAVHLGDPAFVGLPPRGVRTGPGGRRGGRRRAASSRPTLSADRPRPRGQDQERRLESVLRVVGVVQDLGADVEDHRPVPEHQALEGVRGRVIGAGEEPFEELGVGEAAVRPLGEEEAQRSDNGLGTPAHRFDPPADFRVFTP